MRIYGPNGPIATTSAAVTRRSSATFSLTEETSHPAPASASSPRPIGGMEALLALQEVDDVTQRRRRAVTRGRTALDVLEELKLGLLAGVLDQAVLGRLQSAASRLKHASGDPSLDGVLAEIELRVEVELAKMDAPRGR